MHFHQSIKIGYRCLENLFLIQNALLNFLNFRGFWVKIPGRGLQVSYLENTGSQGVDFGIVIGRGKGFCEV